MMVVDLLIFFMYVTHQLLLLVYAYFLVYDARTLS